MDKLNLADQLRAWAKRNEAIVLAAEALEAIGSIEQAVAEARQRADAARVEERDAKVLAAAAKAALEDAKEGAAGTLAVAEAKAKEIIDAAHADAAKVSGKAKADAQSMLDLARSDEAKIGERAKAVEAQALASAKDAKVERDLALKACAEAKRDLSEVIDKLARAKESARKLLEG